MRKKLAKSWDEVYSSGHKYGGEPPLPFTKRIFDELSKEGLKGSRGLYVGCGNGRNYLPLLDLGLNIEGLDISSVALDHILDKNPKAELLHGDFLEFDSGEKYAYIVAIQVFQHGNASQVADYFKMCTNLLSNGGLLFLRVRSVNTAINEDHEVIEKLDDGSFSVRYLSGSKHGLIVHFFSEKELQLLSRFGFELVGKIEEIIEDNKPPKHGKKIHLEGVWKKV